MIRKLTFTFFFHLLVISSNAQNIQTAIHLQIAFEIDGYQDVYLFKKAEGIFLKILKSDSLNEAANYNIGAMYNNYAIHYQSLLNEESRKISEKETKKNTELCYKYLLLSLPYIDRYEKIKKLKKNDKEH